MKTKISIFLIVFVVLFAGKVFCIDYTGYKYMGFIYVGTSSMYKEGEILEISTSVGCTDSGESLKNLLFMGGMTNEMIPVRSGNNLILVTFNHEFHIWQNGYDYVLIYTNCESMPYYGQMQATIIKKKNGMVEIVSFMIGALCSMAFVMASAHRW
jgi:hypothetical protein